MSVKEGKERGEGRTYDKSTSNLLGRNLRLVDGDVCRECADSETGDEPSHHKLLPGVEGGHLRKEKVKLESVSPESARDREERRTWMTMPMAMTVAAGRGVWSAEL